MSTELKAIRFIQGTKISHDYDGKEVTVFGYEHLVSKGIPAIGIPGKQNGIIIIDVDVISDDHKHDGRPWWNTFVEQAGIPPTYTVQTPSGGFHFYFRLPHAINPETFRPPSELSPGVDVKYNGWVAAPPTRGYVAIHGTHADIIEAPHELLKELTSGRVVEELDPDSAVQLLEGVHTPYTEQQIKDLRRRIEWLQSVGSLSYQEWRDGLFSLKAGIDDPAVLEELAHKWTYNQGYQDGDEHKAMQIIERAEKYGLVGPGAIFGILKNVAIREGAEVVASPMSRKDILGKAKVHMTVKQNGDVQIAPTESNVAAVLGAMFDGLQLYHDIRMDAYVYKGDVYSDAELANIMAPMIQSRHYGLGFENIKKSMVAGGIEVLMAARQIDPHKRWLESLTWDGVPRVDTFFKDYVGCVDSDYIRSVGRIFWLGMAARGLRPGCKFDHVIVLEGAEGIRKSTLLETIGGEYYMSLSTNEDINGVECLRKMHQSTIIELPELVGLVGKSGEEIKAIITTSIDQVRALYARKAVRKKRGFIFVGTTNSRRYLKASMGSRRYLPVDIPRNGKAIDTSGVLRDREQLFAEAVYRYGQNENYWSIPESAQREVQSRQALEPLVAPVKDIIQGTTTLWRPLDIYRSLEGMGYINRGFTARMSERIVSALEGAGAKEVEVEVDGHVESRWRLPDIPAGLQGFL